MKSFFLLATAGLLWMATPAQAQRKGKTDAASTATFQRLQPRFGGLTPAQAEQVLGPAFVTKLAGSFSSRAEASRFFSAKGYEYLSENQPDTAAYRFNLAWVLDPANADAYHGLGIISSTTAPEQSLSLLNQGLALAPTNSYLLSDLGASYLLRYQQTKKQKDLTTATEFLQKATTQDAGNAAGWQQLARAYFYQEQYPQAWEAIHKGQSINFASMDFDLVAELKEKLPDPQGTIK
ncbi:tetratricopeptide repeat protein [Hymenobacter sp. 102]|uniref:tetratricopeptide repeat protein n=1 Tax=Hymenobacter sp. 102 TaxID=3403152 RepID=UPI003CEA04ED